MTWWKFADQVQLLQRQDKVLQARAAATQQAGTGCHGRWIIKGKRRLSKLRGVIRRARGKRPFARKWSHSMNSLTYELSFCVKLNSELMRFPDCQHLISNYHAMIYSTSPVFLSRNAAKPSPPPPTPLPVPRLDKRIHTSLYYANRLIIQYTVWLWNAYQAYQKWGNDPNTYTMSKTSLWTPYYVTEHEKRHSYRKRRNDRR